MTGSQICSKIAAGEITKTASSDLFLKAGYEWLIVDINAFPGWMARWQVQRIVIPAGKRGNLSKYAGKTCEVIATAVQRGSPRINFWIKAV